MNKYFFFISFDPHDFIRQCKVNFISFLSCCFFLLGFPAKIFQLNRFELCENWQRGVARIFHDRNTTRMLFVPFLSLSFSSHRIFFSFASTHTHREKPTNKLSNRIHKTLYTRSQDLSANRLNATFLHGLFQFSFCVDNQRISLTFNFISYSYTLYFARFLRSHFFFHSLIFAPFAWANGRGKKKCEAFVVCCAK